MQSAAYSRQYYADHREQKKIEHRQYYYSHLEQQRLRSLKYRNEHKELLSDRDKKYRQSEKGRFAERRKHHRRRVKERASKEDLTPAQWQRILANQQFKCNICGKRFCKSRHATMDHILPLTKGGDLTSSNVQALCLSCNSGKRAKVLKGYINSWAL